MNKKDSNQKSEKETGSSSEDEVILGPGSDGMSSATVRLAIDRKLRKKLVENYDLIEVVNKGRYYTAKAHGKDGKTAYELLIDKQSGTIQVVSQKELE